MIDKENRPQAELGIVLVMAGNPDLVNQETYDEGRLSERLIIRLKLFLFISRMPGDQQRRVGFRCRMAMVVCLQSSCF